MSRVRAFGVLTAVCLAGCVLAVVSPWFLLFLAPLAGFGYITLILLLTMYRLGPRGGDYQRRIHELIATTAVLPDGGAALDVGCGSGSLTVRMALAHPTATVTGVDSWGAGWEYSRDQCTRNARLEGVADRTTFHRQNGARLDLPDGAFDAVVSCMTFHEIRELPRKSDAVVEALRVLRPGGRYVFLDLFADPSFYPSVDHLRQTISRAGASISDLHNLADLLPLRFPLRHPKVLGHAMLIAGTKPDRPKTNS